MRISRVVLEAQELPRFYGIAYWEYASDHAVAYPVPINLVVRFGRWLWHELIRHRPTKLDYMLRDAYRRGWARRR